jgi:hypothetical protein
MKHLHEIAMGGSADVSDGSKAEILIISKACPLFPGGLNRRRADIA